MAEQFESWVQISPFCLFGLISELDFGCWMDHMHADALLMHPTFDQQELETLQESIEQWRYNFRMTLCTDIAENIETDDSDNDSNVGAYSVNDIDIHSSEDEDAILETLELTDSTDSEEANRLSLQVSLIYLFK